MKSFLLALSLVLSVAVFGQDKQLCKGTTKKGTNCANRAIAGSEYCRLHSPSAIRCGEPTKKGTPCQVVVKKEGEKCWRHKTN